MNKNIGTLLAMLLSLAILHACQFSPQEQPALPDEKIAQIMADLSVAHAATTGLAGYAKDSLLQVYFKQVFEIHSVSLENYEKDLRILANDLPRMERIVKQSEDLLTEGKGTAEELLKK